MHRTSEPVPKTALLLSLLCLWIPVASASLFPDWTSGDLGVLVWLLALIPPFLLSYYRGWMGASLALVSGMLALTAAQVVVSLTGRDVPPGVLLGLILVLFVVSGGSGLLSSFLHRSVKMAEDAALTDPLTGLANRRMAVLHLERAFAAAERGAELSVALFDLDHFKGVNDIHGHAAGDGVLAEFSAILRAYTRQMQVAARLGGEEFVVVLDSTGAEGGRVFAERVREGIRSRRLPVGRVTVSAGVAAYEPGMSSPDVLLAAADQALYRAKDGGRDQVVVMDPQGRHPAHAADAVRDPSSADTRKRRVLVVDDDPAALRSVSRALRRFGYTVLESGDPESAVLIARGLEQPLDLVVTDVVMPSMSGFRLVELLTQAQPQLRALYMSGYDQGSVDWAGVPGARSGFLGKPFEVETLAEEVGRVLEAPLPLRRLSAAPAVEQRERGPERMAEALASIVGSRSRTRARAGVWIVSREATRAHELSRRLARLGHRTAGVTRGAEEPLEVRGALSPDLVLLDMEGLAGDPVGLLRQLRLRFRDPELPVIAIASVESDGLGAVVEELPCIAIPASPPELLGSTIQSVLRLGEARQAEARESARLRSRLAAREAQLRDAKAEVLLRLVRAAESRDDVTGRHSERVGVLSGLLVQRLTGDAAWAGMVEHAAQLHDVGKIAVPDAVLRKAGPLSSEEKALMEQHTRVGAEILSGSDDPVLKEAERIALCHHERWDGLGYPCGLAGEEIPLSALVVAVADTYDSMTYDRPYRRALSTEITLAVIAEHRGTQFAPAVVDALMALEREGALSTAGEVEMLARPPANAERHGGYLGSSTEDLRLETVGA